MSRPVVERLAVVGLGLLGGSVAAAARARRVAGRVVGVSRSAETAAEAVRSGLVDEATDELPAGVAGADLLVLATPVFAMQGVLERAAAALRPGCVVTDVGSVKAPLAETLPGLLPPGVHYVGAHPMAGSHETGLRHARADLLEGAPCVVVPAPGADPAAVARVAAFFGGLGARVLERTPARHDAEVAWVSHAPHALAYAFAAALAGAPRGAAALRAGGFRDFTRIAQSDPELWADILAANRKALAGPLQASADALSALARCLEAGDADALQHLLAEARDSLARFAESAPSQEGAARSGGAHPEIQAARAAATKE